MSDATASGEARNGHLALWIGLAFAIGFLSVYLAKLSHAPLLAGRLAVPAISTPAVLVLTWAGLRLMRYRGDVTMVWCAAALSAIGGVLQFRLDMFDVMNPWRLRHFLPPLGVAVMLGVCALFRGSRAKALRYLAPPAYLLALGALAALLAFGRRYRGGLFLAGQTNPSEIVKPLLALFLAWFLAWRRSGLSQGAFGLPVPRFEDAFWLALLWAAPMALLMRAGDLGMVFLLNAMLLCMLLQATRRWGYALIAAGLIVAAGALIIESGGYAAARFKVWINPYAGRAGPGWQILQSLTALYNGGWFGSGLGMGAPQTVPIVSSDFIYAAIGEELGFFGCVLTVLLFAIMAVKGFRQAAAAEPFEGLLICGVCSMIGAQALLNIGGATKALPLTGVPLPFVSHGGSSLMASFVALGLALAVGEEGPAAPRRRRGARAPSKARSPDGLRAKRRLERRHPAGRSAKRR